MRNLWEMSMRISLNCIYFCLSPFCCVYFICEIFLKLEKFYVVETIKLNHTRDHVVKIADNKKVVLTKIVLKNPKNNAIPKIKWNPSKHLPEEKIIVIVPFRNRLSHLKEFIPSIYKQLTHQVNFIMSLICCIIVNIIFFSVKILYVNIYILGLESFYICSRAIWILTRAFQQSKTV